MPCGAGEAMYFWGKRNEIFNSGVILRCWLHFSEQFLLG